jgi:hypothetical protein
MENHDEYVIEQNKESIPRWADWLRFAKEYP